MENKELSKVLKDLRESKGLSLRDVEKMTGISNAYLSQLENNKIGEPSPHILHKLASVYDTSYNDLMKLAGYLKKQIGEKVKDRVMTDVAFSAINQLTPQEKEEVINFLNYIRSRKKKKE